MFTEEGIPISTVTMSTWLTGSPGEPEACTLLLYFVLFQVYESLMKQNKILATCTELAWNKEAQTDHKWKPQSPEIPTKQAARGTASLGLNDLGTESDRKGNEGNFIFPLSTAEKQSPSSPTTVHRGARSKDAIKNVKVRAEAPRTWMHPPQSAYIRSTGELRATCVQGTWNPMAESHHQHSVRWQKYFYVSNRLGRKRHNQIIFRF